MEDEQLARWGWLPSLWVKFNFRLVRQGRGGGMAKKKPEWTPSQLANDPSLRWCPYRRHELVWSDAYQDCLRFWGYEGEGMVRLATLMLGRIDGPEGLVPELSVRRPTGEPEKFTPDLRAAQFNRECQEIRHK